MNKATQFCYIRAFEKGKSIPAFILDIILGIPLLYIAVNLILRELGAVKAAAAIISVCAVLVLIVLYILIFQVRLERFIKREREKITDEMCARKALLMPEADFFELAKKVAVSKGKDCSFVCAFQTACETDADSIIKAYRQAKAQGMDSVFIVSLSPLSEDAEKTVEYIDDIRIDTADQKDITAILREGEEFTDEKADAEFVKRFNKKRPSKNFFRRLTAEKRILPYLICGILFFVLSLVLKYSLYYRLLGAFCIWICLFLGFLKKREN